MPPSRLPSRVLQVPLVISQPESAGVGFAINSNTVCQGRSRRSRWAKVSPCDVRQRECGPDRRQPGGAQLPDVGRLPYRSQNPYVGVEVASPALQAPKAEAGALKAPARTASRPPVKRALAALNRPRAVAKARRSSRPELARPGCAGRLRAGLVLPTTVAGCLSAPRPCAVVAR
jgi:hypothetical protein